MHAYGRLRLQRPGEPEQEYTLSKPAITAGRAEVNDIVLTDTSVSRTHARFDHTGDRYTVTDLGSVNGVRVNGAPVARAVLESGDFVELGGTSLFFDLPAPAQRQSPTVIQKLLRPSACRETPSIAMRFTSTELPRLAVMTRDGTEEVPLQGDAVTIGRDPKCDIVLDFPEISREHARIERRGRRWVVRDLGSANGTWLGDRSIERYTLQDHDTIQLGPALLTFLPGFTQEALSGMFPTGPGRRKTRRTPVVFIAGFMGSELWQGSERVWPNVRYLLSNPEVFRMPDAGRLEARAIAKEFVIVPGLVKLERYNRVADFLIETLGYERGKDVFEFAYDWRQDIRESARQLAQAIEAWQITPPVTIIAHSMGCLVSRWYVERLGGKHTTDRLILMGGPHLGAPRAVNDLVRGPRQFPFRLLSDRLREVLATFPSTYQLLPSYACGVDQTGRQIDVFADDRWLPEESRPLLREARAFRHALGTRSSVPAVSIFGYGIKTPAGLTVERDQHGRWQQMDFRIEEAGDDTVPQHSAVLPGSEIHPVQQSHGTLYADNDVKMRLKLELTRDWHRE
jgi:pSer/pThr/pTyr-binding forkhead associated (FHA) protein